MPERPLLYYITDRAAFATDEPTRRKHLLEKISAAARAGVDYIQLRERDLSTRDLESLAIEAVAILKKVKSEDPRVRTALLVNSRSDVALAAGADGVHLRSVDIPPDDVKLVWKKCGAGTAARISPPEPLIGVSCHSPAEVRGAEANGATFAVYAPVFEKKDAPAMRPGGVALLREACKSKIPVLALGGVTLANAGTCLEAGAAGIAAIRLFQENDLGKIVQELQRL